MCKHTHINVNETVTLAQIMLLPRATDYVAKSPVPSIGSLP